MSDDNKMVSVKPETKDRLDKVKFIRRETYDDVIGRLIDFFENHRENEEPVLKQFGEVNL